MANIKINVDRIQLGLYIRLPVKWNEHPFLLNSFKIKNQDQIRVIRHLGIKFVYMNAEQSDVGPLPVQKDEPKSIDSVNEAMDMCAQQLWEEK